MHWADYICKTNHDQFSLEFSKIAYCQIHQMIRNCESNWSNGVSLQRQTFPNVPFSEFFWAIIETIQRWFWMKYTGLISFIEPVQKHLYKSLYNYKDCFVLTWVSQHWGLGDWGDITKGFCLKRSQGHLQTNAHIWKHLITVNIRCGHLLVRWCNNLLSLYEGVDGEAILDLFLCIHYVLLCRREFWEGKTFHALLPGTFQEVLVMSRT